MSTHTALRTPLHLPAVGALRTIVVATDFSKASADALDWAAGLASSHGAKVVVVHAIDTTLSWMAETEGPIGRIVQTNLDALERVVEARKVVVQTEFGSGRPWDVISRVAQQAKADLVVVGAHTHSALSQKLLGTTADRLARVATVPVLVHRGPSCASGVRMETILAATDFSEESLRAIAAGVKFFGNPTHAQRLHLVHAIPVPLMYIDLDIPVPTADYWAENESDATARMNEIARQVHRDNMLIETHTHREDPAKAILREAGDIKADLIVLGTVGRSGWNRFLMGSVAETVLHHAPCPVLTVNGSRGQRSESACGMEAAE